MFASVMHGPGDVRYERVEDPKILKPTDAFINLPATCICGSDLWPVQPTGDQHEQKLIHRPGAWRGDHGRRLGNLADVVDFKQILTVGIVLLAPSMIIGTFALRTSRPHGVPS